jgi:hypothetical protein
MFSSSGEEKETDTLLGSLERANLTSLPHLSTEKDPVFETFCFLVC